MQSNALLEIPTLVDQIILLPGPQKISSLLFLGLLGFSGACISIAEHRYVVKNTKLPIISLLYSSGTGGVLALRDGWPKLSMG